MNERLPVQRVEIPAIANPADAAAGIVLDELRTLGVDPRKAFYNPMARALVLEWSQGRMSDAGFRRAMGNLLILNPGLKA